MTEIFNKKAMKESRRDLRKNMSNSEKLIWSVLRNRQIEEQRFLRQVSIDKYIVDFYCPKLRLVIEIDGDSHFQDSQYYDIIREQYFESLGLYVIRFTNTNVHESLNNVVEIIKDKIKELKTKPLPLP